MTGGEGRARIVGAGAVLAAATVAAVVLGRTGQSDPLTGSVAWIITAPVAIAASFAIAVWNVLGGSRRLARWVYAASLALTLYWLGAAVTGTLIAQGATASLGFVLVAAIPSGGWTVVLALLQATAVVAAEDAGFIRRRGGTRALLGGALVVLVFSVLTPGAPGAASPLPSALVQSAAWQTLNAVVIAAWMLSLLVTPTVLFVLSARATGIRRRGLARVAIGALVPALVVLLCGLLAALVAQALGWTGAEATWLAIGFCAAMPAACGWLSATVHEATSPAGGSFTSISAALRGALWVFYVLAAIQLVGLTAPALGGGEAAGAIAMALVLGVTFWPWLLVVRWCVRRADPRTRVAAAALAAAAGDAEPAAAAAERILRDVLDDPQARVLIARPHGVWADAAGRPELSEPAAGEPADPHAGAASARSLIADAAGRPIGVVVHRLRFHDLRPLADVVRPLFERAVWEAELREQSERVAAERARADSAAAEARRRIERDLHDGVQGRLVSLGLGLSLARDGAPDPVARDVLDRAVAELHEAVAELRELASGALAARLDGRGLAAAVGDLVARLPIPVDLDIPALDLPATVESTVYFVIAESLTNAVKHAAPGLVSVRVAGGDRVTVVVADDGCGGADVRAGTGLRGLRERVGAGGGTLIVSERMPRGTIVEAVLPCGS